MLNNLNWVDISTAAVTLFLIMDPLGNAPIFNAILSKISPQRQSKIIVRELLIALSILFVFLLAGNLLLQFLGLSQSSLNISGGILLFIISLRMIFPPKQAEATNDNIDDPLIVPLAIPLIAGPSTIAILLLLSSNEPDKLAEWSIALFLAWLTTTILLLVSPYILQKIGERGANALERLMGMILVIIATQMFLNGVTLFIKSLA